MGSSEIDELEAKDVEQEPFLKAYHGLNYFREESAFYTLLYRIGMNAANSANSRQVLEAIWSTNLVFWLGSPKYE